MNNKNKQQVEEIVEEFLEEWATYAGYPVFAHRADYKPDYRILHHYDEIAEYLNKVFTKALHQTKEDILEEVIPVHNARILNEFQKLEDMDERILFRAITKATKETLTPNDKE